MKKNLAIDIHAQPDDTTCGPTCLHAIYQYFYDPLSLSQVISEIKSLEGGGTLAVVLGCHALRRGYKAKIYTYNLQVFDPSWFKQSLSQFPQKLIAQKDFKKNSKLSFATESYLEFLELGGQILYEDLSPLLIKKHLKRSIPILTGLSSTYLYSCAREFGPNSDYDDVRGEPAGHFVVLAGYDKKEHKILIADPLFPNPMSKHQYYLVDVQRLINAIMLGILTYDGNMLIIEPKKN